MNKNSFIIVFVTLSILGACFLSCKNTERRTSLQEDNLKGSVESVEERRFQQIESLAVMHKRRLISGSLTRFNKQGNKVEYIKYDSDESMTEKKIYKYNKQGNNTEIRTYDSKAEESYIETYEYDRQGNMIKYEFIEEGKVGYTETREYDRRGNMIECNEDYGNLKYTDICEYDSKGNLLKEERYNNDKLLFSRTYEYDSQGNNIAQFESRPDSYSENHWTYKYDSQGNCIESKGFLGGIHDFTSLVKYNLHGDVVKNEIYDSEGDLRGKTSCSYKYDDEGNIIKEVSNDGYAAIVTIYKKMELTP